MRKRIVVAVLASAFVLAALPVSPAAASHRWDGYHWARRSNPFFLNLVDSMDEVHRGLGVGEMVASDWSASAVAELNYVLGANDSSSRLTCSFPKQGRIRMCNANYGSTSWAGLAEILVDSNNHITKARAKLNDFFVVDPASMISIMCQEVGHALGLDHQRSSLNGSCMNDNELWLSPNAHDYDMLRTIYQHTDSYRTSMKPPSEGGVFLPLIDEELAAEQENVVPDSELTLITVVIPPRPDQAPSAVSPPLRLPQ